MALTVKRLVELQRSLEARLKERLEEFRLIWRKGDDLDLFAELVFCLLTPQSKARVCWDAVFEMKERGILLKSSREELLQLLRGVRFKNNKARYIEEARKLFLKDGRIQIRDILSKFPSPFDQREWLVKNVKGYGYKEASHFLRNIGLGEELAILDRHILKNLVALSVIDEIPRSLSRSRYLSIEKKMRKFSQSIGIPMGQLDLLLWFNETGEIFK
jgi:N-glycosylase/DNA lyase